MDEIEVDPEIQELLDNRESQEKRKKNSVRLHKCSKPSCGREYSDKEPDAYYCPLCVKEKDVIAKQIDARFSTRPKEPVVSDLQEFEQSAKKFSDPQTGREIYFGRA